MHELNNQTFEMKGITEASPPNCNATFEFGVADGDTFNFFDAQELKRIQKALGESGLEIIDFYCAIRYYIRQPSGKRRPLKFDYKILRFAFKDKEMKLVTYHERGNQHIPVEDLVEFFQKQINKKLTQTRHRTITLKRLIKSQKALSLQHP